MPVVVAECFPISRLFTELRRRNVFKVAIVYAIAAWIFMQAADVMFPALKLPEWTLTFVAALLIIGFPIAVIFGWAFEMTPEGISYSEFYLAEAEYYALEGDFEAALDYLGRAIDSGWICYLPLVDESPVFGPLEGDPKFHAIEARMIKNLQTQRAALGLQPVEL